MKVRMAETPLVLNEERLQYFSQEVLIDIPLPEKFTFPFFYKPHPLTKIALEDLQIYLEKNKKLDHNFGLLENELESATGKMFGVLLVKDKVGRIAYLSAFSGKLGGTNSHKRFVPPVLICSPRIVFL